MKTDEISGDCGNSNYKPSANNSINKIIQPKYFMTRNLKYLCNLKNII